MLVGTTSVSSGGDPYDVERIIVHPFYSSSFPIKNDVAVIKVKNDIEYNIKVNPIALASWEPVEGSIATLTGWGYTSYPSQNTPDILQTVDLNTISNEYCGARFGMKIPSTSLCTYTDVGRGACSGDRFDTTLDTLKLCAVSQLLLIF